MVGRISSEIELWSVISRSDVELPCSGFVVSKVVLWSGNTWLWSGVVQVVIWSKEVCSWAASIRSVICGLEIEVLWSGF